ncbi:MAG: hypothetical protein ACMUHY_09870, partial [Thermoplasmatota archaeon]
MKFRRESVFLHLTFISFFLISVSFAFPWFFIPADHEVNQSLPYPKSAIDDWLSPVVFYDQPVLWEVFLILGAVGIVTSVILILTAGRLLGSGKKWRWFFIVSGIPMGLVISMDLVILFGEGYKYIPSLTDDADFLSQLSIAAVILLSLLVVLIFVRTYQIRHRMFFDPGRAPGKRSLFLMVIAFVAIPLFPMAFMLQGFDLEYYIEGPMFFFPGMLLFLISSAFVMTSKADSKYVGISKNLLELDQPLSAMKIFGGAGPPLLIAIEARRRLGARLVLDHLIKIRDHQTLKMLPERSVSPPGAKRSVSTASSWNRVRRSCLPHAGSKSRPMWPPLAK